MWSDSSGNTVTCVDRDRWIAEASGGLWFYSNAAATSGVYMAGGGGSWNAVSDRARKENLEAVDGRELLARLAQIDITTWNYLSQDQAIRHIGPMAQDFNTLVPGLGGEGETYINSVDADRVALAAIQGLYDLSQEQAATIASLETEKAGQEARLDDLEARLTALEAGGGRSFSTLQSGFLSNAGLFLLGLVLLGTVLRGGLAKLRKGGA